MEIQKRLEPALQHLMMKIGGCLMRHLFASLLVSQRILMRVYFVNKCTLQTKSYGTTWSKKMLWRTLTSQIFLILWKQMLIPTTESPLSTGYLSSFAIGGHTAILLTVELNYCFSFSMLSLLFCPNIFHGCLYLWHPFLQACTY